MQNKRSALKAAEKKTQVRILADFLVATLKSRRARSKAFPVLKDCNGSSTLTYPGKLFTIDEEWKQNTFHDKNLISKSQT